MCFSPTASFVAAGALGAGGAFTFRKVKRPRQLPFAAIPLLFGLQQAVEGVVWLSFGHPVLNAVFSFIYVMFSHVLWPSYVPLAAWSLEPDRRRKRLLSYFLWLGVGLSAVLLAYVLRGPVTSAIVGHCIAYDVPLPGVPLGLALYVLVTCGSCLLSTRPFVRLFGGGLSVSLLIAYWAYGQAFTSVWCFFAAILSLIVYVHFVRDRAS